MYKKYEEYLVESLAYSFDDDENNAQEEFAFNKSKTGDVAEFLHNVGPVISEPVITTDDQQYSAEFTDLEGPFLKIMQWYLNWWFDEMYRIQYIEYYLYTDGTELIDFIIESKDKQTYETIYNVATGTFVQRKSLRTASKSNKLFRYKSAELRNTILDIINQIKNHG